VSAVLSAAVTSNSFDTARRRKSRRAQRQRGCMVYIPAEVLIAAGFDPNEPPPYYRAHGYQRSRNAGSVIISLYREP
jgi:hypothetical protein